MSDDLIARAEAVLAPEVFWYPVSPIARIAKDLLAAVRRLQARPLCVDPLCIDARHDRDVLAAAVQRVRGRLDCEVANQERAILNARSYGSVAAAEGRLNVAKRILRALEQEQES